MDLEKLRCIRHVVYFTHSYYNRKARYNNAVDPCAADSVSLK